MIIAPKLKTKSYISGMNKQTNYKSTDT